MFSFSCSKHAFVPADLCEAAVAAAVAAKEAAEMDSDEDDVPA